MAPSGTIRVEHVHNVLARLNNPVTPAQAETSLRLSQAPKADTARYDRLRSTHLDGQEVGHPKSQPVLNRTGFELPPRIWKVTVQPSRRCFSAGIPPGCAAFHQGVRERTGLAFPGF